MIDEVQQQMKNHATFVRGGLEYVVFPRHLLEFLIVVSMSIACFVETTAQGTTTHQSLRLVNPSSPLNGITLQPPTGITAYSLTFPSSQGLASTLLLNDGTGGLSWTTVPSLLSNTGWVLTGNSPTTSWNGTSGSFLGTTNTQPLSIATTNATAQDIRFYTGANGANERMRILSTGNIGIGTITPTATLHVNGTTRFSGGNLLIDTSAASTAGQLQLMNPARTFQTNFRAGAQTANITYTLPTTAPTAGQVLSSDASGNMSWTSVSSGTVTGTGTTTSVAFWTSSTALGANSNYIWDNTNQRLGIWSSTPSARLHVGGRIMATIGTDNTFLSGGNETVSGTLNTGLGYASLNSISSGSSNVGVGRNALSTLTITSNNTAIGTNALAITSGSNNIAIGYQAGDALTSGSNNIIIGYDIDAPSASGSNQLSIGNLIYGTGINGTGTTVSSGNIGIGINNPLYKLHVSGGDIYVSNGGSSYFRTSGSESDISYNGGADGLMAFDNDATNGFSAFRNNNDQIIIAMENANRSVGIGTDWSTPVARLEVKDGNLALTNSDNNAREVRLYEPSSSGTNYSAFRAQPQTASITYTLPSSLPPASGYVMTSTTSGGLSWTSPWSLGDAIRFARKATDEAISSTTLQDDDHLSLSVDANEVWEIDGVLNMDCSSTSQGGIQVALAAPTGASINIHVFILAGFNTSTTDEIRLLLDTPGSAQGWSQVKTNNAVYMKGIITTSSTAGQLLLRWALNSSGATTTLKQNSYIKLMRIQ